MRASDDLLARVALTARPAHASAAANITIVRFRLIACLSLACRCPARDAGDPFPTGRGACSVLTRCSGVQHLPHVQQHQRPHLVQVGPELFNLVDLLDDHRLVGVGGNQPRQLFFLLIQLGFLARSCVIVGWKTFSIRAVWSAVSARSR